MSTAKIDTRNGTPALEINGETFSLMAMTTRIKDEEYLRGLRKAGVRIFFVFANTDWLRPVSYTHLLRPTNPAQSLPLTTTRPSPHVRTAANTTTSV